MGLPSLYSSIRPSIICLLWRRLPNEAFYHAYLSFLRLLGPVTLLTKSIMQDLWRFKLNWNESIPLELHTKWRRFETELQELHGIRIPRLVTTTEEYTSLELHSQTLAKLHTEHAFIYAPLQLTMLIAHIYFAPSPEWHRWRICRFRASSYVVHCYWLVLLTKSLNVSPVQ